VMRYQEPPSTQPSLLSAIVDFQNESAWQRFLATYEGFILSRCMRQGLNATDAEDVKQTVMMALVRAIPGFRHNPQQRFRGYLTTAVSNAVKTLLSKNARRPGLTGTGEAGQISKLETLPESQFAEDLASSLEDQLGDDLRNLSLISEKVASQVKAHTWQAYMETAINGKAAEDVAKELGVSVAVVYTAKYRVGLKLREVASEMYPEVNK
jgi:RNA polymerase sigma factor (sigma-70 family)